MNTARSWVGKGLAQRLRTTRRSSLQSWKQAGMAIFGGSGSVPTVWVEVMNEVRNNARMMILGKEQVMKRTKNNGSKMNRLAGVVLGFGVGLGLASSAYAQTLGVALSSEGAAPNANAMLDVQSPATGAGKGLLIPRIAENQRTNASAALAGGLLDDTGALRGGAAQGLMVYQTDGAQGFYYNTSATATPAWSFIGGGGSGGDFMADGSVPMTGALNLGGQRITNVSPLIEFSTNETAVGLMANGSPEGVAFGYQANGSSRGTAMGYQANGFDGNVAIGYQANGYAVSSNAGCSVAIGYQANAFPGAAVSNGSVAIGYLANARTLENGTNGSVAVGYGANAYDNGTALGYKANGISSGAAVGFRAVGVQGGVGVGYIANGSINGAAVGYRANSNTQGWSFAKGGYSQCTRYNEEWKGADTLAEDPVTLNLTSYNKYGYGQVNWNGVTANSTAQELFLGNEANQRFTLKSNSALAFKVFVVAVNTSTGDSSAWEISGGIKRRVDVNTTALIGAVVTTMANEAGGLTTNPTLTADTTNGSLKLTVTGVASATVKWNAMMTYSEVRE